MLQILKYAGLILALLLSFAGSVWRLAREPRGQSDRLRLTKAGRLVLAGSVAAALTSLVSAALEDSANSADERFAQEREANQQQTQNETLGLLRELYDALLNKSPPPDRALLETAKRLEAGNGAGSAPQHKESECLQPRPYRFGVRQIRIATVRSERLALDRFDRARALLRDRGLADWAGHVQKPFSANIGSDTVWVVAINQAPATLKDEFCEWLVVCERWDVGLLPCDLRPE